MVNSRVLLGVYIFFFYLLSREIRVFGLDSLARAQKKKKVVVSFEFLLFSREKNKSKRRENRGGKKKRKRKWPCDSRE